MKKLFQRSLSFLLALLTVITLLPMTALQVDVQADSVKANQTVFIADVPDSQKSPQSYDIARTYDDVYAIVDDYMDTVGDNAYWNASVRGETASVLTKLRKKYTFLNGLGVSGTSYLKVLPFTAAVTSKACASYRVNGNNKKHEADEKVGKEYGCTSNVYLGNVHAGDAQCSGFAEYMAYIVFKNKAKVGSGCYTKLSGSSIKNYKIKPGDVLRIKSNSGAAAGHHSVFVYAVNGKKLSVIECNNPSGSCKIGTRTITVGSSDFHSNCSTCAIYSSPIAGVETVETWPTNLEVVLNSNSNLSAEPKSDSNAVTDHPFASGTAGVASKIQKNEFGNYWYYVTIEGTSGWIYGGKCTVKGLGPKTTSVSDFTYLSKYNSSGSVTLKGKISASNCTIINVTGAFRNTAGEVVKNTSGKRQEAAFDWCASSYSLQNGPINSLLTPRKLAAGLYQYTVDVNIVAKTTDGKSLGEIIESVRVVDDWFEFYKKKTAGITLTFDLNGGSYAQSSKLEKLVYKDKAVGQLPVPVKVGEAFIGWFTAKTGGTQVTEDSIVSKNTTLYARWDGSKKSYTVQYLPNGGTGTMKPTDFFVGTSGKLSTNTFTKKDYAFVGWNTVADGTGKAYTDGQSVMNLTTKNKAVVSLYAQWKPVEKTYTVQYNANGGVGTMPITKFAVGTADNLSPLAFKKDSFTFAGWNTAADGSGTAYADRQEVKDLTTEDKAVVTLYAQWKEMTEAEYLQLCTEYPSCMNLTATKSGNLMTRPVNTGTVVRNLTAGETLVSTALYCNPKGEYWYQVRTDRDGTTGYVYAGNTGNDGIADTAVTYNISLAPTDIPQGTGSVVSGSVSAKNDILYSVTGILNDSDPNTAEQSKTITSGFSNIGSTAINHDLLFGSLSRGAGTLELTAKLRSAYSTGKDLKWAEYTAPKHTISFTVIGTTQVTYDKNTTDDVENMPANQTKTDKKDLTLAKEIPVRTGYTFLGWATKTDALEAEYQPEAVYTEDASLTLYALWQQDEVEQTTYPVTYDKNTTDEVENMPAQQQKTDKQDLTLAAQIPVRAGYTFLGWATMADAAEAEYQPEAVYTEDAPLTLYALWQRNEGETVTYTVSYTADKPFYWLPDPQTKTQGVPLTLNDAVPTSQFYTFLGWEAEINGERLVFQPGDTFTLDTDVTFTALCKVTSYLYDAVGNTYWELGETFKQVEAFDTSDMYHITLGASYSDEILALFGPDYWQYTIDELTSWDCVPMVPRDGKLDFYVTPGAWVTIIGSINCAYTFERSEDIMLDVQILTMHGNGGFVDPDAPEAESSYSFYAIGHPQFGEMFVRPTREGYTLLGWSPDPAATEALYAPDATWSQLDPTHTDLYAIWQQNTVTE